MASWSSSRGRSTVGRRLPALLAVIAALLVLVQAGCGGAEQAGEKEATAANRPAAWQSLPRAPLGPRHGAHGFWTGSEALIVGGSDARPCPPTADCGPPEEPPLADGAAYDPERRKWRRIADAPVPFEWAETVVLGKTAYLWIPGSPGRPRAARAFLSYTVDEDRWRELPLPPRARDYWAMTRAGNGLVVYSHSDEHGQRPDYVFDPASESWSELPPDPLSPSFDRVMAWSGRELVLFDHELVPNPGAEKPAVTRAAAFDLEKGSWRRLPDSEILGAGPWVATRDGRLVNPTAGGADGGQTNNWGRTYPFGGIFEPATGRWSALPLPPAGALGAGALSDAGAAYFAAAGSVFDARNARWLAMPPLDRDGVVTGRTVLAAGHDLLVFGGARWRSDDPFEADLLDDAYVWSPPASP